MSKEKTSAPPAAYFGDETAYPPLGSEPPAPVSPVHAALPSCPPPPAYFGDEASYPLLASETADSLAAGAGIAQDEAAVEEEPICMMSTPQQLKVMQEKLADTLQTLRQNKARLVEECQALQADQENREQEHMERKQDFFIADLEDDDRQENVQFASELDAREAELEKQSQELVAERAELERRRSELEKNVDAKALTKEMLADKADFKRQVQEARFSFDSTMSEMEKKHQKALQEMRASPTGLDRFKKDAGAEGVINDELKRAFKTLHSEYSPQLYELQVNEEEKDSVSHIKEMEKRVEQMRRDINKEAAESKRLLAENYTLTEESLKAEEDVKGLRRRLLEVKSSARVKHESEKANLVERCEKRLAISESKAQASTELQITLPSGEEVLQKQRELLEEHNRTVSPSSSSANASGFQSQPQDFEQQQQDDEDVQKAILEAEAAALREQKDMEGWIRSQCRDMGMGTEDLDSEMREEMERAYRSR